MTRRALPSAAEAAEILGRRRTRPPRRPPPVAGRALAATLGTLEGRFGRGSPALAQRWREIVGETLARVTEPVKLTRPRAKPQQAKEGAPPPGGTLELRVEGAAALLVQHQQDDILARANLVLGEGAAARLKIVQGPVRRPADAAAPVARRRSNAPLDAAAEAALAAATAAANDGLREALVRLGRAAIRGR